MKFIYAFIFLLVLSCNTVKKEYVCGDHPCTDKKEFNEYFSKNLTIEIKSRKKTTKNINVDLVKLNTNDAIEKKNDNKIFKEGEQIKIKNNKDELKVKKIRLLEEKKILENESKKKAQEAKISKLKKVQKKYLKNEISNNRKQVNKIVDTIPQQKNPVVKDAKKNNSINSVKSVKSKNVKSVCDKIKDCDIEKIAELLIKKGKNKPFPNIASN